MSGQISVRFNKELEQKIADIAVLTGKTRSGLVQDLVEHHIDELADLYLCLKRLESPEAEIPLDLAEKELLSE